MQAGSSQDRSYEANLQAIQALQDMQNADGLHAGFLVLASFILILAVQSGNEFPKSLS